MRAGWKRRHRAQPMTRFGAAGQSGKLLPN
jgi:hypothetical protein